MDENDFNKKYTRNVKCFIQIIPSVDLNWDYVKILDNKKTIYVRYAQDFGKGNFSKTPNYWIFSTDGVLYNLQQNEIYTTVTSNLLESALLGNNIIILAFGQTGSGKSTTISGLCNCYNNRGITLRLLSDLFEIKKRYKQEARISYKLSFVETTKNYIMDLLAYNKPCKVYSPFKNISTYKIKSEEEGIQLIFFGEGRRAIICDSPYTSHVANSILTIHVTYVSLLNSRPIKTLSKVHIIDMSGADTGGNASCMYKNIYDVGAANLVKTQIEQLLLLQDYYTNSKKIIRGLGCFVEYLSDSLQPQTIMRFIGHVKTTKDNLHITTSLLRFTHTARCTVPAKLKPFTMTAEELAVDNMKKELDYLIKQNYLNSMLMNQDIPYKVTEERAEQMQNAISDFIQNRSDEIALLNVSDARAAMKIFKDLYHKMETEFLKEMKAKEEEMLRLQIDLVSHKSTTYRDKTFSSSKASSQETVKKKRLSDRFSSITSQQDKKVGTVGKSGLSLGKHMSTNFQGNVTKSKKRSYSLHKMSSKSRKLEKSSQGTVKSLSVTSSKRLTSKTSEQEFENILKITFKDYDEAWKIFSSEELYNDYYDKIKATEHNSKCILEKYNDLVKKTQNIQENADSKKEYLLKIQMFKENNLKCGSDAIKLAETEKTLNETLINLINELSEYKENLLTLQAELKISIDDYHRIKKELGQEFAKFCMEKYNVSVSSADKIQCIEDELLSLPTETKPSVSKISEDKNQKQKDLYYKLQKEMRKIIQMKCKK